MAASDDPNAASLQRVLEQRRCSAAVSLFRKPVGHDSFWVTVLSTSPPAGCMTALLQARAGERWQVILCSGVAEATLEHSYGHGPGVVAAGCPSLDNSNSASHVQPAPVHRLVPTFPVAHAALLASCQPLLPVLSEILLPSTVARRLC